MPSSRFSLIKQVGIGLKTLCQDRPGLFCSVLLFACLGYGCGPSYDVIKEDFRSLNKRKSANKHTEEWDRIKSAREADKPQKALQLLEELGRKVRRNNNPVQQIKVFWEAYQVRKSNEGFGATFRFKPIKALTKKENSAVRSLAYATLASQYQEVQKQVQSAMIDTAKKLPSVANPLLLTWGSQRFKQKIKEYWKKALTPRDKLASLYAGELQPLLEGNSHFRPYRPSLYDLLAYHAIEFFKKGDGHAQTQALEANNLLFSTTSNFIKSNFHSLSGDTGLKEAIKVYQSLAKTHRSDSVYPALMHAELQRLRFVYNHVALPEIKRQKLYYRGLDSLIKHHPENQSKSVAYFYQAHLIYQGFHPTWEATSYPKQIAIKKCNKAIAKFPETYGGKLCKDLKAKILGPSIHLKLQSRYLPYKPGRMRLEYKNMDSLHYTIVQVSAKNWPSLKELPTHKLLKQLKRRPAAYDLRASLPVSGFYESNSTTIGVPALGTGDYVIIASSDSKYNLDESAVSVHHFQVSNISTIPGIDGNGKSKSYYAVNPENGNPLEDVQILAYPVDSSGNLSQTSTWCKNTDSLGKVRIPSYQDGSNYLAFVSGSDTFLFKNKNLITSKPSVQPQTSGKTLALNSYHFSPKDTLKFKGFLPAALDGRADKNQLKREKIPINLFGPSGVKLKDLTVSANGFGSFTDHFQVPERPGRYKLQTPYSATCFTVQQKTSLDKAIKLKANQDQYFVGQKPKIFGRLKAFGELDPGNQKLFFKVKKDIAFPYTQSPEKIPPYATSLVKKGFITSDHNGEFRFTFTAEDWPGMKNYPNAIFQYLITVKFNPENQPSIEKTIKLNASRKQLFIDLLVSEWLEKSQKSSIKTVLHDINGNFLKDSLKFSLFKLKEPTRLYRKQYWPSSAFKMESSKAFHLKFPYDPYKKKPLSPEEMRIDDTLFRTLILSNRKFTIPENISEQLKPGRYRAKIVCRAGSHKHPATDSKHFNVYNATDSRPSIKEFSYTAPSQLEASANEPAEFLWGTAADKGTALVQLPQDSNLGKDTFLTLKTGQTTLDIINNAIPEKARPIHVASVNQNRLYRDIVPIIPKATADSIKPKILDAPKAMDPGEKDTLTITLPDRPPLKNVDLLVSIKQNFPPPAKRFFSEDQSRSLVKSTSLNMPGFGVAAPVIKSSAHKLPIPNRNFEKLRFFNPNKRGGQLSSAMTLKDGKSRHFNSSLSETENVKATSGLNVFQPNLTISGGDTLQFPFQAPNEYGKWQAKVIANHTDFKPGSDTETIVIKPEFKVAVNRPESISISGDRMLSVIVENPLKESKSLNVEGEVVAVRPFNLTDTSLYNQKVVLKPKANHRLSWRLEPSETVISYRYRIKISSNGQIKRFEGTIPVFK